MDRYAWRSVFILVSVALLLSACSPTGGVQEPVASPRPTDDRAVLSSASFLRLCAAGAAHIRGSADALADALDRRSSEEAVSLAGDLETTTADLTGSTEQDAARLEETAPADPRTQQIRSEALALYERCAALAVNAREVATVVRQDPSAAANAEDASSVADTADALVKSIDRFTNQLPKP